MLFTADSVAAAALAVPSTGAGRDVLYGWLAGLDPSSYAGLSGPGPQGLVDGFAWTDLRATSAFWNEGDQPEAGTLSAAVAGLLGALHQLGGAVAIVASGTNNGFAYSIGTAPVSATTTASLLRSHLPGADVAPRLDPPVHVTRATALPVQAALAGRPAPVPAPGPQPPVLERLAQLGRSDWSLITVATPVSLEVLRERHRRVASLLHAMASTSSVTHVRRPGTTDTVTDPVGARLAVGLEAELAVCEAAIHHGGVVTTSWVAATDPATAAAVVATIGGVTATAIDPDSPTAAATAPLPLRAMPVHPDRTLPAALAPVTCIPGLVQPPCHDVDGLPCAAFARFDEHVPTAAGTDRAITWGTTPTGTSVRQPVDELTSHVVITGRSGSAKTSAALRLANQVRDLDIGVLMIEPVKDDLARSVGDGAFVWRIGDPSSATRWAINLLQVPDGAAVGTHIDAISALFGSALGLFNPLPFIIDIALRRVYRTRGWDLATGQNPRANEPGALPWPTLSDLVDNAVAVVTQLGYVGEIHDDLIAALTSRLGSLTDGAKGQMLDTDAGITIDQLLDGTVVINLHAVGDDDQKAFISSALMLLVTEHLGSRPTRALQLLFIIDEAHRIFSAQPATSGEDGAVTSRRHATDTVARCLAELRASGVGVCVIDQSIAAIDRSATVNTATKIALAAADGNDKAVQVAAMNLDPDQADHLTSLPPGRAAALLPGADRPVLVDLDLTYPAEHAATPALTFHDAAVIQSTATTALTNVVLRCTGPRAHAALAALRATVVDDLPPLAADAMLDATVRAHLRVATEQLGRTRRWSHDLRAQAVDAAATGADTDTHPVNLLADGAWPEPACRAVCPDGGCLVGELTRAPATRMAADPLLDIARVHPPEGRARLHSRLIHEADTLVRAHPTNIRLAGAYDRAGPGDLAQLVRRCLVGRAYGRHLAAVPQLLADLPGARDDGR